MERPERSRGVEGRLLVGAVAYHPKAVTIWETIRDLFRGHPLELDFVLFSNYEAQVEALFRGMIEIAWNTPVAWVRCRYRSKGAARPLVMRDSDIGFTTKLVAREGSGIRNLADLRGKRVAFGSRDSAQAAILPEHFLWTQGGLKSGKDYTAVRFDIDVGKHGDTGSSELEVLDAVQAGEADAGAVGQTVWEQCSNAGSVSPRKVKPFWTSPAFCHCNFTALPSLAESRSSGFVRRLLSMDYADPEVKKMMDLEGLKRWVAGRIEGYEELEKAMEEQDLF
jgi:phosphonate transport system substrate-binding protein